MQRVTTEKFSKSKEVVKEHSGDNSIKYLKKNNRKIGDVSKTGLIINLIPFNFKHYMKSVLLDVLFSLKKL